MDLQLYYELQAKMKALENSFQQAVQTMGQGLEEVRDTFNLINPSTLPAGFTPTSNPPAGPPVIGGQPTVAPPTLTPTPPFVPKQRSKLNTPVLSGPLKDVVEDMLTEKAQREADAAAPKRIAPYEVVVKRVAIGGTGNDYWATVLDPKYGEEAMVPVPKGTYDEYMKDPDGLVIDLGPDTLEKTEWLPVQEPTNVATATTTEV